MSTSSSKQQLLGKTDEAHCMTPTRGGGGASVESGGGGGASASSWAPPSSPSMLNTQRMANLSPKRATATTAADLSAAADASKRESQQQKKDQSIQDKLGNMAGAAGSNALLGVLELLKVAGGATLSTTGKIVAPPLHVTRTVLLPSLWVAFKDYISTNTPQRVKDWFRIVSSSLYHLHCVLIATDRGKELQGKVGTVGADIIDVAGSDASRQAFMDTMACLVKLSEALHTPETRALLDQMSVLGCRVADAASSGRAKQLLHDTADCAWAAIELFADPAATLAFAEVTAYLCHALEMENALYRPLDSTRLDPQQRAQRRRDRNRFERQTYVDPHLLQDPDTTVEQAILSSIGSGGIGGGGSLKNAVNTSSTAVSADASSLPSNVMFTEQPPPPRSGGSSAGMGSETPSFKDENDNDEEEQDEALLNKLERDWEVHANDVVDVSFLQEKIAERAAQKEENAFHRTKHPGEVRTTPVISNSVNNTRNESDDDEYDLEDLAQPVLEDDEQEPNKDENVPRAPVDLVMEDADSNLLGLGDEYLIPLRDPSEPAPTLVEEEPAIDQFYRTLDDIMSKKRNETVQALLDGQFDTDNVKKTTAKGKSWHPKAAAAAGAGNEQGQDTVKDKVSSIRSALKSRAAIGVGKQPRAEEDTKQAPERPRNRPPTPLEEALDRYTILLGLFLGFLAVVATIWFCFGCYGIYIYFFGHRTAAIVEEIMEEAPLPAAAPAHATQEIVVRIVREVVHMSATGEILETGPDVNAADVYSAEDIEACADDIAACVVDAIK